MPDPGLYVVATPIGNLEDISHRALRILKEVDGIAAEDTRHTRGLLDHYGIEATLLSLHDHNEEERIPALIKSVQSGESIALVSDAGTPLVSDPGYRLVRAMHEAGLPVFSVPGASSVTAALSIAGLPSDRFLFEGFLPAKASGRVKRLKAVASETATLVFFESSHRIELSISDMAAVLGGQRQAAVCREMTKKFETVIRGSLEELKAVLARDLNQRKGEFVVLVEGSRKADAVINGQSLAQALCEFLPASQAARVAAKVSGASRQALYRALKDS